MDILILDLGTEIKGECTLPDHKEKIELLSYSHGLSQQITNDHSNQKRTSGKPNHQDLVVSKYLDLASPALIDHCNEAKVIKEVKLTVGQNESGAVNNVIVYDMKNVLVSSYSVGGGGGSKPIESILFNYSEITWTYKPQTVGGESTGQTVAKWNLATNKAE